VGRVSHMFLKLLGRVGINRSMLGLLAGDLASKVGILVSVALLARHLGESDFGLLAWAQSLVAFACIPADFGLGALGTRELAKNQNTFHWYQRVITRLRFGMATIVFLCAVVLAWVFIAEEQRFAVFWISAIWLLPYSLSREWIVQGMHRPGWIGLIRAVHAGAFLLLVWLWSVGSANVANAAAIRVCAECCAVACGIWLAGRISRPDRSENGLDPVAALRCSVPLLFTLLFTGIYTSNFDTVLLGILYPSEQAGWFAAAQRLYVMIGVLPKLLLLLYYPRFAASHGTGEMRGLTDNFHGLVGTCMMVALPVVSLVLVLAPEMIYTMYGAAYAPSGNFLRLLALAGIAQVLGAGLPCILMATGNERRAIWCFGLAMLANIAGNFIAIPIWGPTGAAGATVVAEIVVLFAGSYFVRRTLNVRFPPWSKIALYLVPALAVLLVAAMAKAIAASSSYAGAGLLLLSVGLIGIGCWIAVIFFLTRSGRGLSILVKP
jgi:O-antigen/teichoic acid export membrane protein